MFKSPSFWQRLIRNGITNKDSYFVQNDIFTFNIIWLFSTTAFILFFAIIFSTVSSEKPVLVLSNVFLLLCFFLVWFLIKKKYILLAKNIFTVAIYGGIWLYDYLLGHSAGVYFYYFTFLFAALTLFNWKRQKLTVLLYGILPVLLITVEQVLNPDQEARMLMPGAWLKFLYLFNLALAFLLIVAYAIYLLTTNKKFETSLFQSQKYLQTLIDNTEGSIWSINTQFQLTAFNHTFSSLVKEYYDMVVFEGFDIKQITAHPRNPRVWEDFYQRAVRGETFTGEYFSNHNYYEVQVSPIYNLEGNLAGATFHSRNVTSRKQSEEKLQQISLNIKTLVDNTEGSIWSINNQQEIIVFNKNFKDTIQRLYGEEIHEGFDIKTLSRYANRPKEWETYYKQALEGRSYSGELYSNGDFFELQFSPIYNVHGKQTGAAFYTRIVTHKKQNEEALMQMGLNLQTLIDNTEGSIWSISRDFKVIAANQVYRDDMRHIFSIEVVPGFDMLPIIKRPGYPEQWLKEYERVFNGETFNEEYMFEGNYYELYASPIRNIYSKVLGAAFYARNITQRKENEKELISAKDKAEDASRSKAQFLSNMSHELRTPLNGIIGLTNILLSESYLPSQRQHLETLKYSSDHMLSLVDDILDFNKIEAGKVELSMESFNLKAMLDKMSIFFIGQALEKNLRFDIEIDPDLNQEVLGDITRLRQVLNNLLSNAIKFTNRGYVRLTAQVAERIGLNHCRVYFGVTDSGIGIPSAKLEKVFESFTQADARTTRKYGGTGLGLTISKKLVALMNGNMEVDSIHGKGSCFSFDIVFECNLQPNLPTEPPKLLTDFKAFKNLEILIAEDNAVNMLVAKNILRKWNIQVTNAENGQAALNWVKEKKFDLVLMDLEMPVMDGLTAVSRIREFNTKIPIIALTAASFENLQFDLQKAGLNDFVQKPFRPEELYNKIHRLINLS
jgi:signal transduction histidine kinase/CheY-like chemotaxis protein